MLFIHAVPTQFQHLSTLPKPKVRKSLLNVKDGTSVNCYVPLMSFVKLDSALPKQHMKKFYLVKLQLSSTQCVAKNCTFHKLNPVLKAEWFGKRRLIGLLRWILHATFLKDNIQRQYNVLCTTMMEVALSSMPNLLFYSLPTLSPLPYCLLPWFSLRKMGVTPPQGEHTVKDLYS